MRMTETQKVAVRNLLALPDDEWQGYGYGHGKYRVALRALSLRAPGTIEIRNGVLGEMFRLTPLGRYLPCPADHGLQCCGAFELCARNL